ITDLTGAAVWGHARRAAVESPRAWGGVIDLPAQPDDRSLAALTAVLTKGAGEDQVAVRPAGVFARRLLAAPAAPPWTPTGPVAVHGGPLADRIAALLDESGIKVTTGAAETLVVTSDADDPIATAQVSDAANLILVSTVDELFGLSGSPETAATFDALAHQREGAVSITVDPTAKDFQTAVVDGRVAGVPDWAAFVPAYTEFRPSPLLRELPDALRHVAEADDGGGADVDSPAALRRLLDGADDEQARAVLSQVVRTQTAFTLGLPSAAGVDDHEEFLEIGFSSLTAVELRRRLEALTGLELSAALVYDCPTPAEVVEHLLGDRALVAELQTRERQAA
ncbi:MAG: hypothetical protein HOY78_15550, partial [Saccharothrix sp.]|nr:hypothetical protein [Saccharothrix sp.]